MNKINLALPLAICILSVNSYVIMDYTRFLNKSEGQLLQESKVLCDFFNEKSGTFLVASIKEEEKHIQVFLSDGNIETFTKKINLKLSTTLGKFEYYLDREKEYNFTDRQLSLSYWTKKDISQMQQQVGKFSTVDHNLYNFYYFPDKYLAIQSKELEIQLTMKHITLAEIEWSYITWGFAVYACFILQLFACCFSIFSGGFFSFQIFHVVFLELLFFFTWKPDKGSREAEAFNFIQFSTALLGIYFTFINVGIILSNKMAPLLKILHCVFVVTFGFYFNQEVMLAYTLCHIVILCQQSQLSLSSKAKVARIVFILAIVASLHIFKCYQEAIPIDFYSYQIH